MHYLEALHHSLCHFGAVLLFDRCAVPPDTFSTQIGSQQLRKQQLITHLKAHCHWQYSHTPSHSNTLTATSYFASLIVLNKSWNLWYCKQLVLVGPSCWSTLPATPCPAPQGDSFSTNNCSISESIILSTDCPTYSHIAAATYLVLSLTTSFADVVNLHTLW